MFRIATTNKFEKDAVRCEKRGLGLDLLQKAVEHLEQKGALPPTYKPHTLKGIYSGHWEAHVLGDWLLIWTIDKENKTITLVRTGTHSDLFK